MSNRKKLKHFPHAGATKPGTDNIRSLTNNFPLKYNGYICPKCDKGYLSVDVDAGVTPMFTPCFATQGCDGQARSMGYPEGEPPARLGEPIIVWYKPDPKDYNNLSAELIVHVERGGLIRKATQAAPDWVKEIV